MVFPHFYGAFGCVAAVVLWGYTLKCVVVVAKVVVEVIGALVINDVKGGSIAVVLLLGLTVVTDGFDGVSLAVFYGE